MPPDCEKETHYLDNKGRKRKRKRLRSISEPSGTAGPNGKRVFSASEKELIVQQFNTMKAQACSTMNPTTLTRTRI